MGTVIKEAVFAGKVLAVNAVSYGLYRGGKYLYGKLFGGSTPEVAPAAAAAESVTPESGEAATA